MCSLPFFHLDDDDFQLALLEFSTFGSINYDPDRLASLKFNPLLSDPDQFKSLGLGSDLDPDSNFYSKVIDQCEYYTESLFSDKLTESQFTSNNNENNFSLLHLNIRSISNKICRFINFLGSINHTFSVIGITETWLQDSDHSCDIPGYNFIHNHRPDRSGGGVGLFIRDHLDFKERADLGIQGDSAETFFVEINRTNEKNMVIGVVYRPPDCRLGDFVSELDSLLSRLCKENKTVYLLGDWNVNLMNHSRHTKTSEFLDVFYSNSFFPLITRPTRITAHKASLIDNIFTNDPCNQALSGLFFNDISDHLPIFSILSQKDCNNHKEFFMIRDRSAQNVAKFKHELGQVPWDRLPGFSDPLTAYDTFLLKYKSIYELCFSLKKVKAKKFYLKKPWFSKGLTRSVKKKNILYKRFLNNATPQHEFFYKCYKNKLNHSIRIAKRLYYEQKIEQAKSNAKCTWRLLNEVMNRKQKKNNNNYPSSFLANNRDVSDPSLIAEQFCKYFSSVGSNLAKDIPLSSYSHLSFLSGSYANSIFISMATEQEVLDICDNFRPGTAAGFDNINMNLVKESISLIIKPLTHIFNLSLSSGIVPDQMKIARVIPLFKSGDKSTFTNYRPISILPAFSKILERIVYNRILSYLNERNILSDSQFGFRKNHSTEYALSILYDRLSNAIDNNEYTAGIFLDLSKAFDTINHQILLEKLNHYGIRGVAHSWISSYLSNRKQFVQYDSVCSAHSVISCGVPQGSILGPLLFLIYINDLCNVSKVLDFILFADDTNIFFSHRNEDYLQNTLNVELDNVTNWCQANRLSINIKKSKFMIFKPRQKKQNLDISITLTSHAIERVKDIVFLGVISDENLTWKPHIAHVSRKISKSIGVIYKSSFCLSPSSLRTLYFSLIYPYLVYCISVWGSTYSSNLNRIFILQKKCIRIISKSSYDAHTEPLFKALRILKFADIYKFQVGKMMFLFRKGLLPSAFCNMFPLRNTFHSYNTRTCEHFHVASYRTNIRYFAIRFQGPKLFNSFDSSLKNANSISSLCIVYLCICTP